MAVHFRPITQDDINELEAPDFDVVKIVDMVSRGTTLMVDAVLLDDTDPYSYRARHEKLQQDIADFRYNAKAVNGEDFEVDFPSTSSAKFTCRKHPFYSSYASNVWESNFVHKVCCPMCTEEARVAHEEHRKRSEEELRLKRLERDLAQAVADHEALIRRNQTMHQGVSMLEAMGVKIKPEDQNDTLFDEQGRFNPLTKYGRLF